MRFPVQPTIRKTKIRYGDDFAGFGTFGLALKAITKGLDKFAIEHVFSSENNSDCRDMLSFVDMPQTMHNDIVGVSAILHEFWITP